MLGFPDLASAAEEFEVECTNFIKKQKKHTEFRQIEHSVLSKALYAAQSKVDLKEAAALFGDNIATMSRLIEEKKRIAGETLLGRIKGFLTGLYPLVNLSLSLAGTIASVSYPFLIF